MGKKQARRKPPSIKQELKLWWEQLNRPFKYLKLEHVNLAVLCWIMLRIEVINLRLAAVEAAYYEVLDGLAAYTISVNVMMAQFYISFQSSVQSILNLFGGPET